MIGFGIGVSSIFALPFAISYDRDDGWGVTTVAVYLGPFFFSVEWGAA